MSSEVQVINTVIVAGLLLGGIYGLVATSISLSYGVMKAINWSYGIMLVLFSYITWILFFYLGWDPLLSITVTLPIGGAAGYLMQKYIFHSLTEHGRQLMATLGIAVIITGSLLFFFGADYKALLLPYTFDSIQIGETTIQVTRLITGVSGMVGLLILHLLVTRTWYGMAIRATAQNPVMAEVAGIDVRQIHILVSILAMACLAISGPLLMLVSSTDPTAGGFYITLAFVITLIGSPGNLLGAFVGGLVIGLSEVLITWFLGSHITGFSTFLIFIVVLILMPYGQQRRR